MGRVCPSAPRLIHPEWHRDSESGLFVPPCHALGTFGPFSGAQVFRPPASGGGFAGLINGGFETYTGTQDDGAADTFASWITGGAGRAEATAIAIGSNALLLRTIGASDLAFAYQEFAVTAGVSYTVSFVTRGDGGNAGAWQVYDVTNAAEIISFQSTSITGTDYTPVSQGFNAPGGCTTARLAFFSPSAFDGFAYFDSAQVTQP